MYRERNDETIRKSNIEIDNSIPNLKFKNFNFISIEQIVVEIEDFLEYKDSLSRAIDLFNSKFLKDENFKLNTDTSIYTLRISKKNGKPNMDYPSILMNNQIKNNYFEKISVVIEDVHFSLDQKSITPNNLTTFSKDTQDEEFKKVQKKKCCESCLII